MRFPHATLEMEVGAFYQIALGLFRTPGRLQNANRIAEGLTPTEPPFNLLPHPYGGGPIIGGQLLDIIKEANGSQSYIMGSFLIPHEGSDTIFDPYPDQSLQLRVPSSWGQGRYGGKYQFYRQNYNLRTPKGS